MEPKCSVSLQVWCWIKRKQEGKKHSLNFIISIFFLSFLIFVNLCHCDTVVCLCVLGWMYACVGACFWIRCVWREWWIKGLRWVWSCDCHGPWWPYLLTDYHGEGEVDCFPLYFLLLSLHPSFCQDSLWSHPSWLGWILSLLWLPVLSQDTRMHEPAQKH